MPWRLGLDALPALARGFALLGSSGGGGRTTLLQQLTRTTVRWPIPIHRTEELDPRTACIAVGFAGSTLLLTERIPGMDPFGPLIRAAEHWTGAAIGAVCGLEGAGLNGLVPLLLTGRYPLVDSDFMGRALPRIDQLSVLVDEVPGTVVLCGSGGEGIMVLDRVRPPDVEPLVRTALVQAGGAGPVAVAGLRVGDLLTHAILGSYQRALRWGSTGGATGGRTSSADLAVAIGGRLLGTGRVRTVETVPRDSMTYAIELLDDEGTLLRLVGRSELLAVLRDGHLVARCPEIIAAIDTISGDVLEVDDIKAAQHLSVLAMPAPDWWTRSPSRLAAVTPSAFGLSGLDVPMLAAP